MFNEVFRELNDEIKKQLDLRNLMKSDVQLQIRTCVKCDPSIMYVLVEKKTENALFVGFAVYNETTGKLCLKLLDPSKSGEILRVYYFLLK